ncbi:type I-E CRISPR-associated protein Cas7/Cse4/CasC [Allochromatium vinosum]|uniref:CRISPR-associated protein, Cse4 family n=1 Tax=Allochromatium vinosum (strain ATCC 17899 / DSM 180 / NBRC 103801 / NCIMB 10441 / D) TaxID=572477 RepID=D3RPL8_ALLVD|nr:type I-E CRISPR-associated protein Cas7/Cse4/CasC [Allochromatium vinosum]ADC61600.1 CRISPR-associated protein, Cse4 family [Allochromatium vinosum DSM 180]
MNTRNFVNFHVLISHSPSCLNRDDMNMQKTAIFGGKTRVRISSQSLKRAIRYSDYYARYFISKSQRTRRLFDKMADELSASAESAEQTTAIEKCALYAAAIFEGKTKIDEIGKYERDKKSDHIETQIIPFSCAEIEGIKQILLEAAGKPEKGRIEYMKAEIQRLEREQRTRIDLDVALSGRMANSELIYPVDGALAVAHAITTHTVEPQDIDWFTAVDDLTLDAGETGAGHLNTQQFSAGVFYRYASLNLRQLQFNLGLLANINAEQTTESRARALDIARHVLHLLATVVPSAKQQSFAAHNLADFVIVSLADQPVSLANAFEEPIERERKIGGFLQPSITALADYWSRVNSAYGLDEQARAFALRGGIKLGDQEVLTSIADLEQWLANDGRA